MKKYLWLLFVPTVVIAGGTIQIFQNASAPAGTIVITQGKAGQTLGQVLISSAIANGGTYTYIQSKSCTAATFTDGCAYASNITAHSTLIVGCVMGGSQANTINVSDSQSDVFSTAAVSNTLAGGNRIGVYYALNAVGGATTVTCKDNLSTAGYIQQSIHEYAATANATFDVASSSAAAQVITNPTATPITTTVNSEFVFAFAGQMGGAATGQSGTLRENYVNDSYVASEDTVVASAGSYTSTFTQGTGGTWVMIQAAFK